MPLGTRRGSNGDAKAGVQQGCPFCDKSIDPTALSRAVNDLIYYRCLVCGATWERSTQKWKPGLTVPAKE